jgi:hypothetical protein
MGSVLAMREAEAVDPLLTAEEVALLLKVSKAWVWDHSSRRSTKAPQANLTELLACPTSSLHCPSGTATDVSFRPGSSRESVGAASAVRPDAAEPAP